MISVVCGVIVWLHFAFALREWRRTRGTPTLEIDMGYTRSEAYLPASFRAKLADWMRAEARPAEDGVGHVIERGRERIRVLSATTLPNRFRTDAVVVVLGDLSCGEQCTFEREIYVEGKCTIGAGSRLQAIAVDGDLVLGSKTTVTRWADAEGQITLGEGCRVGARVTSRRSIHLNAGARASSFYAPEVRTLSTRVFSPAPQKAELSPVRVPPSDEAPDKWPRPFERQTDKCWRYRGDLRSDRPLEVLQTLIVQGPVHAPAHSRFTADVKASGSILVGPESDCFASLVSDRSIAIGSGSVIAGFLLAGDCALLDMGVRGADGHTVAAFAQHVLYVRDAVALSGKLAAGQYVQVLGPDEVSPMTVEE